jgi:hypothetical protein
MSIGAPSLLYPFITMSTLSRISCPAEASSSSASTSIPKPHAWRDEPQCRYSLGETIHICISVLCRFCIRWLSIILHLVSVLKFVRIISSICAGYAALPGILTAASLVIFSTSCHMLSVGFEKRCPVIDAILDNVEIVVLGKVMLVDEMLPPLGRR